MVYFKGEIAHDILEKVVVLFVCSVLVLAKTPKDFSNFGCFPKTMKPATNRSKI
jgi:hypothetical protein